MVDLVMIGEITLDDTVLESGDVQRGQPGGGTVYAALGAVVWGRSVGINAVVGHEYPDENLRRLTDYGINVTGVVRYSGTSLRLWLLHEEDDRKQQVPHLSSASFAELDQARGPLPQAYLTARGFHLAPATPDGQHAALREIRGQRDDVVVTLDMLTAPYIPTGPYSEGAVLRGLTAFLPSRAEVEALWGNIPLTTLIPELARCYDLPVLAVKLAAHGSLVYDSYAQQLYHIPIFRTETRDPTGAGDAYCGGFLGGLVETGSALEAGVRGTVSASFAVEYMGALPPDLPVPAEIQRRRNRVAAGIVSVNR